MDGLTHAWTAALLLTILHFFVPMAAQAEEVSGCPLAEAGKQKSWDHDCAAAIETEHDSAKKAELVFRRAYVLNERQAYEQSLADLNAACALVPHYVKYLLASQTHPL
jgi:hypothetical protein